MSSDFSKYTNYRNDAGVEGVVFGANSPILEVELNEVQEIQNNRLIQLLRKKYLGGNTEGLINFKAYYDKVEDSLFIPKDTIFLFNGILLVLEHDYTFEQAMGKSLCLQLSNHYGNPSYFNKYGNLDSDEEVQNWAEDSRYDYETSQRKYYTYRLYMTGSPSGQAYFIGEVNEHGFFINSLYTPNAEEFKPQVKTKFYYFSGDEEKIINCSDFGTISGSGRDYFDSYENWECFLNGLYVPVICKKEDILINPHHYRGLVCAIEYSSEENIITFDFINIKTGESATSYTSSDEIILRIPDIFDNISIYNYNFDEAYAVFDSSDRSLIIFKDKIGKYTNGQIIGTKTYYAGIEDITGLTNPKWHDIKFSVTKVIIEDTFKPKTAYYMFGEFINLAKIEGIKNLDTSECTNMNHMFFNCVLTSLDLSGFNTSNVTDMSYMFASCGSLTSLDLSGFNTSNVTDMEGMFSFCYLLTSLDLSGFNTSSVTNMVSMFKGCYSLTATLNIMNMPSNYDKMCYRTSRDSGQLTLKYISPVTSADIDLLVATKNSGNVVNGGQA